MAFGRRINPESIITLPITTIDTITIGVSGEIEYELHDDYARISLVTNVPGHKHVSQKRTIQIPKRLIIDIYNKYIKSNEEENKNET